MLTLSGEMLRFAESQGDTLRVHEVCPKGLRYTQHDMIVQNVILSGTPVQRRILEKLDF